MQPLKAMAEAEGRILGLATVEIADGGLRRADALGDLLLCPATGLQVIEEVRPVHRASSIECPIFCATGAPIVNIGKVVCVRKRSPRERTAFGQRLLRARVHAGLSQVKASKELGISQSNLSDLEGPAESSTFTAQIARLYGCDAHWLATGEGEPGFSVREPAAEYGAALAKKEQAAVESLRELRALNPDTHERLLDDIVRIADGARTTNRFIAANFGVTGYVTHEREAETMGKARAPSTKRKSAATRTDVLLGGDSALGGLGMPDEPGAARKRNR